jgi:hypothetical protein
MIGGTSVHDLWLLDGNASWTETSADGAPDARFDYAATFDSIRGRLIIFGGDSDSMNSTFFQDIWEW